MNAPSDNGSEPGAAAASDSVATDRQTDTNSPWTIRNMAIADRDAAAAAARRKQQTMAEWLGEAIRYYVAAERGNGASYGEVISPAPGQAVATMRPTPPAQVSDIGELRELVQLAIQLGEAKDTPLLRQARATVRDRLKDLKPAR